MRARDNPFRSERIEQLNYRLAGATWSDLLSRLEGFGFRAAIVGRHGTGKTTLLEQLAPRLAARGWRTRLLRLGTAQRAMGFRLCCGLSAGVESQDILLVDGAEQLSAMGWWRFCRASRNAGGVIITVHRPGRLPTLYECRSSVELLAELAGELLRLPAGEVRAEAEVLFERHGGDLREALRGWYDRLAEPGAGLGRRVPV
jgi:hypothetical protein